MKHHSPPPTRIPLTPNERAAIIAARRQLASVVATLDALPALRQSKIRNLSNGALKLAEEVAPLYESQEGGL